MKIKLTLYLLFCSFYLLKAQTPTPGKKQELPIVIKEATIHVGNGDVIENGVVVIKKGVIVNIGKKGSIPIDKTAHTVIDAKGKHVYPGFINVNNTLGITEIGAVRATRDYREVGTLNPHVRSAIAFNTESKVGSTIRSNGVLITQPTPRGGLISGQSSIMRLDAWNWEDAAISMSDGIHLNWPRSYAYKWTESGVILKKNENRDKQINRLEELFVNAKAYNKSNEKDVRLASIQELIVEKKNLYIHSNSVKDIIESIEFAKKHGIEKIVLVEGKESYLITEYLKENNIPVILSRVHSLPMYEDDSPISMFELASKLDKAGVLYCLGWSGDMEAMNSRNIMFGAGNTVAYGVEYEKAVASVTLNTAKILGIANKYGSLEKGKSATLVISEGDALDMRTNSISYALIDGRVVDLNNHQKELNKKYTKKYGIVGN